MPYPGVPKELTPKMDRCVRKVMKDGKSKSSAIAICKTSIMSQTEKTKEEKEPWKTVEGKEKRYLYFTSENFSKDEKEKTIDKTKEGKLLKNVEIFKVGTYRGIEYKESALDKMVANFHYLKAFDIFAHVPVRADHPSMFGVGDIIDKVGGYVADLRRDGKKLVADIRITSEKMWNKIMEGSYVNRSSEIGTYDDNQGTIYSPVLYGFAWVDIPAVEGLSPKFSYSKDKNVELINLNNEVNMEEEKIEETFPPKEEESEEKAEESTEETVEEKKEEVEEKIEETVEEKKEELKKEVKVESNFDKMFPKEAEELRKYKEKEFDDFFSSLVADGKITPAMLEEEKKFAKTLSVEAFAQYKILKESAPKVVKFNDEGVATDSDKPEEEANPEKEADKAAEGFIKETE
jgi:hypothetical protein